MKAALWACRTRRLIELIFQHEDPETAGAESGSSAQVFWPQMLVSRPQLHGSQACFLAVESSFDETNLREPRCVEQMTAELSVLHGGWGQGTPSVSAHPPPPPPPRTHHRCPTGSVGEGVWTSVPPALVPKLELGAVWGACWQCRCRAPHPYPGPEPLVWGETSEFGLKQAPGAEINFLKPHSQCDTGSSARTVLSRQQLSHRPRASHRKGASVLFAP